MCRADDADHAKILASESRKARKPHKCDECRRVIEIGETYLHERGIGDGPFTNKTCSHCQVACDWLSKQCGGWVYTQVEEELREHWDEDTSYRTRELAHLIWGMDRFWRTRRGALMPVPTLEPVT